MSAILLVFMISVSGSADMMVVQFASMRQCENARTAVMDAITGSGAGKVAKVAAACAPLADVVAL